jgi:hypothetical protein
VFADGGGGDLGLAFAEQGRGGGGADEEDRLVDDGQADGGGEAGGFGEAGFG